MIRFNFDARVVLVFAAIGVISLIYWLGTVLAAVMNAVGWR